MYKDLEIELIENSDKKKKKSSSLESLATLKKKIVSDLEDIILLKINDNTITNPSKTDNNSTKPPTHIKLSEEEIKNSDSFIKMRNKFMIFYNSYIDINKCLIEKTRTNQMIKDIVNEMVENVLNRLNSDNTRKENTEIKKIKEVEILGKLIKDENKDMMDIMMID